MTLESGSHATHALIVSASEKAFSYFYDLLQDTAVVVHASDVAQASRLMAQTPFDMIIINTPLVEESGERFAVTCAEKTYAGVLLVIKEDKLVTISPETEKAGVLVLTKPAGKSAILSAVRLTAAVGRRLFAARSKADTMQSKMDEMKTVNRAKWLLIGKLGMAETDAHRYIEKLAMDVRRPRREIAEGIIKTYEN